MCWRSKSQVDIFFNQSRLQVSEEVSKICVLRLFLIIIPAGEYNAFLQVFK